MADFNTDPDELKKIIAKSLSDGKSKGRPTKKNHQNISSSTFSQSNNEESNNRSASSLEGQGASYKATRTSKEKYPLGFVIVMVGIVGYVVYNFASKHKSESFPASAPTAAEAQCVDRVLDRQLTRLDLQTFTMEQALSEGGDIEAWFETAEKEVLDEAVTFCSDLSKCIPLDKFIGLTACVERELSEYNSN